MNLVIGAGETDKSVWSDGAVDVDGHVRREPVTAPSLRQRRQGQFWPCRAHVALPELAQVLLAQPRADGLDVLAVEDDADAGQIGPDRHGPVREGRAQPHLLVPGGPDHPGGRDLAGHPVAVHRGDERLHHRPPGGDGDHVAMTTKREWSSMPVTSLHSRPFAKKIPPTMSSCHSCIGASRCHRLYLRLCRCSWVFTSPLRSKMR